MRKRAIHWRLGAGGFAEYTVAHAQFVYPIPEGFDDQQAAPCAGIIGFRCLRIAQARSWMKLGF